MRFFLLTRPMFRCRYLLSIPQSSLQLFASIWILSEYLFPCVAFIPYPSEPADGLSLTSVLPPSFRRWFIAAAAWLACLPLPPEQSLPKTAQCKAELNKCFSVFHASAVNRLFNSNFLLACTVRLAHFYVHNQVINWVQTIFATFF